MTRRKRSPQPEPPIDALVLRARDELSDELERGEPRRAHPVLPEDRSLADEALAAEIKLQRERRLAAERARVLGLVDRPEPVDPVVAEREHLKSEAQRIKAMGDTRVNTDGAGRLVAAARLDVFAMMHQRGSITPEQHHAVRRLETDIHLAAGVANTQDRSGTGAGGCQERVTQRMVDASARVAKVVRRLPVEHGRLILALLSPHQQGSALTRWRGHVDRIVGQRSRDGQADEVHCTCAEVAEAYRLMDERRCA